MSAEPSQAFARDARSQGELGIAATGRAGTDADRAAKPEQVTSLAEMRCCPYCWTSNTARWGRSHGGRQRWQCKPCDRTFSATTRTILAGLREPNKVQAVLDDMLAPVPRSCRKLGVALGLDKMTVWSWRRKLCESFATRVAAPVAEPIATARTMVRESRKASREWVDHARDPLLFPEPDRLRWVDYRRLGLPLPQPMSRYRVAIEAAVTEMAAYCAVALRNTSPTIDVSPIGHDPAARVEHGQSTFGVSSERSCAERTEWRASASGLPLSANGIGSGDPLPQSRMVALMIAQLELFLRPFRGPATKHLSGYLAWFVARLPGGGQPHRESAAAAFRSQTNTGYGHARAARDLAGDDDLRGPGCCHFADGKDLCVAALWHTFEDLASAAVPMPASVA